jgi:capsule polysaccharide export protein KpsE/RkpR
MIFRLLNYVVQRRTVVGRVTLVFLVVALLYVFISGRTYVVHALLFPPAEEAGEGVLSAWMEKLNLPSVVSPGTAGSTSAAVLGDILSSRRLGEMIIGELSLKEHFKTKSLDDALRELRGRTGVSVTETGLIRLSVADKDPAYALKIARAYIAGLDSLNRFLQSSRAEQTREFMGAQIAMYRAQIQRERHEIASFQGANNIIDFDQQVRGAIDVAADLKVRTVLAGIERDLLKDFTYSSSMELRRKEAEYENLTAQLRNVMTGDSSGAVFIPLKRLPGLAQRYAAMQADLEVDEHVYSYLLERYEQAGVEKARRTPVVQVVDEPVLPEKPAGMRRWLLVLVVTFVGFVWIVAMIAWWGWVQGRQKTSDEERAFADLTSRARRDWEWARRKLRL